MNIFTQFAMVKKSSEMMTKDPAFEQAMSALDEDDSFNPYGQDTGTSSQVEVKKKEATPRRTRKRPTDASPQGMRHTISLSASQWERLSTALACVKLTEGATPSIGTFLLEMTEEGLRTSHPKAFRLFREYASDGVSS